MSSNHETILQELTRLATRLNFKTRESLDKLSHLVNLYQLLDFKTHDAKDLMVKVEFALTEPDPGYQQETFHHAKEELLWMLDHAYAELLSRNRDNS